MDNLKAIDKARAAAGAVLVGLHFTDAELAILCILIDNIDVFVPIDYILSQTDVHTFVGTVSIKVHVSNIRKKLGSPNTAEFAVKRSNNSYALNRLVT